MELVGDNIQVCRGGGGCTTFGNFLFLDGLITDFQVNGNRVGEHFFPGGAGGSQGGVNASVAGSYHSFGSNYFSLVLDVETDSATGITVTNSLHFGEGGHTSPLDPFSGVIGQEHLAPGSSGQVFLQYQDVQLSGLPGEIEVHMMCTEGCSDEFSLTLPLD